MWAGGKLVEGEMVADKVKAKSPRVGSRCMNYRVFLMRINISF